MVGIGESAKGRIGGKAKLLSFRRLAPSPIRPFVIGTLLLSGCVSLEELPPGSVPNLQTASATSSFPDLDSGSTSIATSHFTIKGYSEYDIRPISVAAESIYEKIGNDAGIYSFTANGSYTIVVYKDREEYLKKTHQPAWSRGVGLGKSLYVYPGLDLDPVMAHELTHLVLNAYFGENKVRELRWLVEGLAMNQEYAKMTESERTAYLSAKANKLRSERVPFTQMTFFVPNSEERRRDDAWYLQVASVVTYLLSKGSATTFAQMMNGLRTGMDIDRALSDAYPSQFRSLSDLENAWKYTI